MGVGHSAIISFKHATWDANISDTCFSIESKGHS